MRRALALVACAAAALAAASVAGGITYGAPDGNGHPEVGALLAPAPFSDGTWAECSGTLIAPRVFLTAAHCDEGTTRVAVTFDPSYAVPSGRTYWGTWNADPDFNQTHSDPDDLAVVVLDAPGPGIAPARLPAASSLTGFDRKQQFTSVGYGAHSVTTGPGGIKFRYSDTRYVAAGTFEALVPSWLRISQNPATGNGGTCYGDSGGPNFVGAGAGETNVVAAITVTGDAFCRATNVDYRLDTPAARAFLGRFVVLP